MGEPEHPQHRVRLVHHPQLLEDERVALGLAVEGDAARHDLARQQLDFLADPIVDGLQDFILERQPAIAGHDRRKITQIELRHGFGLLGFFDAGDRYRLIAGHVLIGHEQLEVEEPHLDRLREDGIVEQ